MSKITRLDAIALIDQYDERVKKRLPMSKTRDWAIGKVREVVGEGKGPMSPEAINYVRLVKHYFADINSKIGFATVHDLFTGAVHQLYYPICNGDVQKAIKRSRVLYDKNDRRIGLVLREEAA